jgi:hypothetical protein
LAIKEKPIKAENKIIEHMLSPEGRVRTLEVTDWRAGIPTVNNQSREMREHSKRVFTEVDSGTFQIVAEGAIGT